MVWPAELPDSGRQLLRLQLDRQAPVDIELVSGLSVTSICTEDALTQSSVISATEAKTQVLATQPAAANFFDANWKINDKGQAQVPVDKVTEISANYFDNNWALPHDNNLAYPPREVTFAQLSQHSHN